jgi:hypothetical protein
MVSRVSFATHLAFCALAALQVSVTMWPQSIAAKPAESAAFFEVLKWVYRSGFGKER